MCPWTVWRASHQGEGEGSIWETPGGGGGVNMETSGGGGGVNMETPGGGGGDIHKGSE